MAGGMVVSPLQFRMGGAEKAQGSSALEPSVQIRCHSALSYFMEVAKKTSKTDMAAIALTKEQYSNMYF